MTNGGMGSCKRSATGMNEIYKEYDRCWLRYDETRHKNCLSDLGDAVKYLYFNKSGEISRNAYTELIEGITRMTGSRPADTSSLEGPCLVLSVFGMDPKVDSMLIEEDMQSMQVEGFLIKQVNKPPTARLLITSKSERGLLYGVFKFLLLLTQGKSLENIYLLENPKNKLRMINQWDNLDGSIERGYAGRSILYSDNVLAKDRERITFYARLLASIGINGIVLNNVNVHREETRLIDDRIDIVRQLADIFRGYGIRIYLSINFASPIDLGGLSTADPLDMDVADWWKKRADYIYSHIPDFGGFLVKADSEHRPGPYTYGRNHADGANMLAAALKPHGGLVIWRCFVYNCQQDWRDKVTDRAKAAYDNYKYLDGSFDANVILQVKNGPMDFQVREPVSPLFGAMEQTNMMLELQITQEYTGQQRHLCYLVTQWKEILEFDTYATGEGTPVKSIVDGSAFGREHCGMAGVSNIGSDHNWTGHYLAQANLYGYGRLAWDPDLSAEEITLDWIHCSFGNDPVVVDVVSEMLLSSWPIYESYTAPLGIGWMVNPNHHYGPNVDGYEYSRWGTYHKADFQAIGVDRTKVGGTGFTAQYREPNFLRFESLETCPEELVLFFHRLPYTYRLKSGKTVIQHIYDTHFLGVEQAKQLRSKWESLKGRVDTERFGHVLSRLNEQVEHAKEWRDVINSYFYRKTGIPDEKGRTIY